MEMVGGCCVCLDERGWDENPLVYCDGHGCNVAVHQACYGIVKVPSGPWFCCKCQSTERVARVKCELCPFKEGALKRTDNGGWAHVVCALYIPEVRFGNVTTMEPIKMSSVPHERFLKTCYICEESGRESKTSNGACMACNKPGCKLNFHVTCAQSKRMLCEEAGHYGNVQYVGYCSQHWTKKFGVRPVPVADPEKKPKEKKRARQDSVSSTDGSATKPKKKPTTSTSTAPKSALNSSETSVHSSLSQCVGTAEKSAAESLNLLQQMSGVPEYFPNPQGPKTPLNSFIAGETPAASNNKFNMASILNATQSGGTKMPSNDEYIDIETVKRSASVHDISEKHSLSQKPVEKHKSSSGHNDKETPSTSKGTSQSKKLSSSSKNSGHSSKPGTSEGKKRKTPTDADKAMKKKRVEERRKLQMKRKSEKQSRSAIPKPSRMNLFEDDRLPPLFPKSYGERSPESFQDLLESQWNQGAQFLIQKASNHDVGSLLSCLYQLRAENDDLEKRLEQLSARRDRLIAATSRLSTPITDLTDAERPVPLSAMLAKLKSEPVDSSTETAKTKKSSKSKETLDTRGAERSTPNSATSKKKKLSNGLNEESSYRKETNNNNHEFNSDDLDCNEVLSEDNSLNTPPKDSKSSKQLKKEQETKRDKKDTDKSQSSSRQHTPTNLQTSLIQPPISNPTDPRVIGGVGGSTSLSQNPAEFIHQVMRQQQLDPNQYGHPSHHNPSSLLNFINGHSAGMMGNFKMNGYNHSTPNRENHSTSNK